MTKQSKLSFVCVVEDDDRLLFIGSTPLKNNTSITSVHLFCAYKNSTNFLISCETGIYQPLNPAMILRPNFKNPCSGIEKF